MILLAILAAAGATPDASAAPPPPVESASDERCDEARRANTDPRSITICAERPQGYRLDPDVMAAKKAKKRHGRGAAPKRPENFKQQDCATVGPMGCREGPVIDVVSAAVAAAQMAAKAAQGENVGKMFVTDPHPSEYQLYLIAKHEREEREAEEAAAELRAKARRKAPSVADEPPPAAPE